MPCYRFAESNERFMQLYEEQIMELRKTRRFLSQQINKSPDGKRHAEMVHAESPMLKKMHRKLQLQIIDEAIRQEEQEFTKRKSSTQDIVTEINGLKDIQRHNKQVKAKMQ